MPLPNLHEVSIPVPAKGSLFVQFTENGRPTTILLPCGAEDQHWSVGRNPVADIAIPLLTVSSQHAVIELRGGKFWWHEGSPTNASLFVNDGSRKPVRKDERWPIFTGVAIELPGVRITFEIAG